MSDRPDTDTIRAEIAAAVSSGVPLAHLYGLCDKVDRLTADLVAALTHDPDCLWTAKMANHLAATVMDGPTDRDCSCGAPDPERQDR